MIDEARVRATLNEILDPCSRAAGCPAGLDDMGLVRVVEVQTTQQGASVRIVIGVTEYGCLMGAPFAAEAHKRLAAVEGIVAVDVVLDDRFDWDRDDMSAAYRERLARHRARRGIGIPVVVAREPRPPAGSSSAG